MYDLSIKSTDKGLNFGILCWHVYLCNILRVIMCSLFSYILHSMLYSMNYYTIYVFTGFTTKSTEWTLPTIMLVYLFESFLKFIRLHTWLISNIQC